MRRPKTQNSSKTLTEKFLRILLFLLDSRNSSISISVFRDAEKLIDAIAKTRYDAQGLENLLYHTAGTLCLKIEELNCLTNTSISDLNIGEKTKNILQAYFKSANKKADLLNLYMSYPKVCFRLNGIGKQSRKAIEDAFVEKTNLSLLND